MATQSNSGEAQTIPNQVDTLLELSKSVSSSDNFYIHIMWLIEGLELWHKTDGRMGHSPDHTKRYIVSSIINMQRGNSSYVANADTPVIDLPTESPEASNG